MEMLIGGTWQRAASGRTEDVTSPFDGAVAGTVPVAGADDVRTALDRAESGKTITEATGEASRSGDLIRPPVEKELRR
jgi:acyl-CoA reductase-like NAD-dependent aldehyde dehydrogenase